MSDDPEPEITAHTVIRTNADGTRHVQHYGADHVVEGSVRVIELLPGETVVVRHLVHDEKSE